MKSRLLKLTSVLSAVAFVAVTMFSNPAKAELVNANDVVVDATYENALATSVDKHVLVYKCFVFVCTIDEKAIDDSNG